MFIKQLKNQKVPYSLETAKEKEVCLVLRVKSRGVK